MQRNPRFFERPEFKKLQLKWYAELKKRGFKDHERLVGEDLELAQRAAHPLQQYMPKTQIQREAILAYYLFIERGIEQEEFTNQRDKIIMTLLSQGLKLSEIGNELELQGLGCHRQTIRFVIRRFELKWNIKNWHKKDMTSNLVIRSQD